MSQKTTNHAVCFSIGLFKAVLDAAGHLFVRAAVLILVLPFLNVSDSQAYLVAPGYVRSDLVRETEVICTATVLSAQCAWKNDQRGNHIYTQVELLAGDTIKGRLATRRISLEVVGGKVGDITETVSDSPVFVAGEQTLLFLDTGPLRIAGGRMGKMSVSNGRVLWDNRAVSVKSLSALLDIKTGNIESETEQTFNSETDSLPVITSITPDIAPAGTDTLITISGTGFGEDPDLISVEFFYGRQEAPTLEAPIISRTDTEIVCLVPLATTGYPGCAGSGPVTVSTWLGTSDGYPFRVTFGYDGMHWGGEKPVLTYYVNENTPDTKDEGIAVRAAAETWNKTGSGFRFNYAGSHTRTTPSQNGKSEVMWGQVGGENILASAYSWTQNVPGSGGSAKPSEELIECDIIFNDVNYNWSTSPKTNRDQDIETIVLHEFGHWLSLRDLYGNVGDGEYDQDKVMYGYSGGGSIKRVPHPDDVAGIHYIYTPAQPPSVTSYIEYPSADDDGVYEVRWSSDITASSYQLERSSSGADWEQIYSGPHTYFLDAVGNGSYRYRSSASNSAGSGDWLTGDSECQVQLLWEGSGEPNDPFLVGTAEQLDRIGVHYKWWSKHFKLIADIDLSGYDGQDGRPGFHIIAPGSESVAWTGVFDGDGHIISNLYHVSNSAGSVGLFGRVAAPDAEVKRLGLVRSDVELTRAGTNDRAGSLIGNLEAGTVTGCYAENAVVGGKYRVGGLVGENAGGKIVNCYADAEVFGSNDIGGLTGSNFGVISASASAGTVSGNGWLGGLAGSNNPGGSVTDCYSSSTAGGNDRVGGLVGQNWNGTIARCYSTGTVIGVRQNVGGLVGDNSGGSIEACFWDTETSGQLRSAGGSGKTTAEMMTAQTFLDAGWDFTGETNNGAEDIWSIQDGRDYPRLSWEAAN